MLILFLVGLDFGFLFFIKRCFFLRVVFVEVGFGVGEVGGVDIDFILLFIYSSLVNLNLLFGYDIDCGFFL